MTPGYYSVMSLADLNNMNFVCQTNNGLSQISLKMLMFLDGWKFLSCPQNVTKYGKGIEKHF